jgi:hypothetical protein
LWFLFWFSRFSLWATVFWSTSKDDDTKYVPLNNVTREVLDFFDQYDLYMILPVSVKKDLLKVLIMVLGNGLNDIEDLTVFALRSNSGRGSVVLVMCISKENVNTIIFSNSVLERDYSYILTIDRNKFTNWFKTLFN